MISMKDICPAKYSIFFVAGETTTMSPTTTTPTEEGNHNVM